MTGITSMKDVRRVKIKAESLDGVKIMRELHSTNFDSNFDDRYWRVSDIYLIENDRLTSQFEEYKNELTELGRASDSVTETLAFSAETEKSCKEICKDGYKVGSKKRHVLGHTGSGVHLVRHYDILTRYLMYQQYTSPAYIIVYKIFLGKTKPIVPRLHKDDHFVPPYIGFDSHVSARHVDREMTICEALNCSYVYLYEFDQISSNPVKYPRQILPYVIVQLEKKFPSVPENPFLSVGSDASRSTWEVKGETRRGFRFMFTKSGLKGKHKVFSRTSSNFGSHLKGQILEMRTKSASSQTDAKPPRLQKIGDKCESRNTKETISSKPPDLQKFTSKVNSKTSDHEKFALYKEIKIPRHLLTTQQLTNLKPCVKLKRLNLKHVNKFMRKSKHKPSVSTDLENKELDSSIFSKGEVCNASDLTASDGLKFCLGQKTISNAKLHTGINSNDSCELLQDMKNCTESFTFNVCDITKGRDKTLKLAENKSAKLSCSQNVTKKSICVESDTNDIKLDNSLSNKRTLAVKSTESEVKDKRVPSSQKVLSYTQCTKRNEIQDPLFKNKLDKDSSSKTNALPKQPPKHELVAGKQNSSHKQSSPLPVEIYDTNHAFESVQNNPLINKDMSKSKQDSILNGMPLNDNSSSNLCHYETKSCVKDGKPGNKSDLIDNTLSQIVKYNENKDVHQKEMHLNKNKDRINDKKLSSRCSPVKTKFGEFEYKLVGKLDKNKEKQKSKVNKQIENIPIRSKELSPDISTKHQEYDFIDQNCSQNQKHVKQNLKSINCKDLVVKRETAKKFHNSEFRLVNDICLEKDDESKNPCDEANTLKHIGENSKTNEQIDSFKKSKIIPKTSACSSGQVTDQIDVDRRKSDSSQIRTQHRVLEKSKSPVAANAAPDMLNINPVLVSAQTSTPSVEDNTKVIANETFKDILASGNQTSLFKDSNVFSKSEHFISGLTSLYNDVSCVRMIKQFSENIPQTLLVNPVIRTSFSAKRAIAHVSEGTPFKDNTMNMDKQNSQPKTDSNMEQLTANKLFEQQNETIATIDVTLKGEKCKINTVKNDELINKTKRRSETCIKAIKTLKRKTRAAAVKDITSDNDGRIEKLSNGKKVNKVAFQEKNKEKRNPKTSKSASQEMEGKQKEYNSSCNISAGVSKGSSQNKIIENKIPREVKTKNKTSSLNLIINHSQKKKTGETKEERNKQKVNNKDILQSKEIVTKNVKDSISVAMPVLKELLSHKQTVGLSNNVNSKQHSPNNEILKSKKETLNGTNAEKKERAQIQLEKVVPKSKQTKSLAILKSLMQQKDSDLTARKKEAGNFENQNNVKIDLHTADRFRSFLSSTAAVALQRRKSIEQKGETDEDMNVIQNSHVNEELENIETKETLTILKSNKNRDSKQRIISTENKLSCQQKQHLQNVSKESIRSPKYSSKIKGMNSLDIQDSDSQDTIIGGIPNSPISIPTPLSTSNNSLKHDNYVTTSKPTALQLNMTSVIKQENVDDQTNVVTMNGIENNYSHQKENKSVTHSVNQVSSTINSHPEFISADKIKEEPVEQELGGTLTQPLIEFESQPVKLEPFSPDTSTTFFPKIRDELAKGTSMLDATQCRSAIVDTLKELSFVLKFLTDNNAQNTKEQKEQTAVEDTNMCNNVPQRMDETTKIGTRENAESVIHPQDYQKTTNSYSPKIDISKGYGLTPNENICHPFTEDLNCEHPLDDHEFQYDYILKSSEDEYQSANESFEVESFPLKESDTTSLVCLQSIKGKTDTESLNINPTESLNINPTKSYLEKEKALTWHHEKDELPCLFDPYDETDITFMEQFGIPIQQDDFDTNLAESYGDVTIEEETDGQSNLISQQSELVNNIKMEQGKNIKCKEVKPKPKKAFNLKSGILNKGLKERKNMFDLKIKSTKSSAVGIDKHSDKKTDLLTKNLNSSYLACEQSSIFAKKEIDETLKEESHSYKNKTHDIMSEVYNTVCQKLSSLKETDNQENDNPFSKDYFLEKVCDSSVHQEDKTSTNDTQTKAQGGDELNSDPSLPTSSSFKVKATPVTVRKNAVIPFETVRRLKRQQFWKYKKGITNKKLIDYRELIPRMSSRPDKSSRSTSPKPNNNKEADIPECSEKADSYNLMKRSTEISKYGTEVEKDRKEESSPVNFNRKRSCSDTDENVSTKHMRYSSEKSKASQSDANRRSRSRSSHRSSSSKQRSSVYSSVGEKLESPFYGAEKFPYSVRPNLNKRFFPNWKPIYGSRTFIGRGTYRNYHTHFNVPTNRYNNFSGKASFSKSGTGYFSWRRKYVPKKALVDGFVLTRKGTVQSMSECVEWTRFKERETLRDQIENAIKEYRRTFEDTPDDMKGDEKVASYLSFLTEKLDTIQSKRDKITAKQNTEDRREKQRSTKRPSYERKKSKSPLAQRDQTSNMFKKLEKAHNAYHHENLQHSSIAQFSGSLASDSDSLSYKQRRHASGIEELLKEHISKHYEHLTKQIKQEIVDLKTSKLRKEHRQSSYEKDMYRSKYDDKRKYNQDKYHSTSQERYDSKRPNRGDSYKSDADKKHSGKTRYTSQHYDKHDEKYLFKDKYDRRYHSSREYSDVFASRGRYDSRYKSRYRDYGTDRYNYGKFGYKNPRHCDNRYHNRDTDFRKTYDYQQNYDKYQNRYQEKYRGYKYMNKNDTENPFDLRNKVQHSKAYEPQHLIKRKKYNKAAVVLNDTSIENHEDVKTEPVTETEVKDEFDATNYRSEPTAYRGFSKRGRGFSRGSYRFYPGYKNNYLAPKFSRFRNPRTYYNHGDRHADRIDITKDNSQIAGLETNVDKTDNNAE